MHVFKVQTRVKHTMRVEKAGVVFMLSLELGAVDVCICHNRNRNKTTSNIKKKNDERNAECLGGLGWSTEVRSGPATAHAFSAQAGAKSMHWCFLGPDAWAWTGIRYLY